MFLIGIERGQWPFKLSLEVRARELMPELPEVETTRAGLEPLIVGHKIIAMYIYDARLRWPVDKTIVQQVQNAKILTVKRRSKYLLIETSQGCSNSFASKSLDQEGLLDQTLLDQKLNETTHQGGAGGQVNILMIHLGMSGRLQVVSKCTPREKHSHIEWQLSSGQVLRYTDPRRFGSVHLLANTSHHRLLDKLGPEPLDNSFNGPYLLSILKKRRQAIKLLIMNAHIVVGVGNIYASESLFRAKIHPSTPASMVSRQKVTALVAAIKDTLGLAIAAGGTTLRDFQDSTGQPGYFKQELLVYGRAGEPCKVCTQPIAMMQQAQRATYFCAKCQKLPGS